MGRNVPGGEPHKEQEYIPDVTIGGWVNRLDPEPVTFVYKTPTEHERRTLIRGANRTGPQPVRLVDGVVAEDQFDVDIDTFSEWRASVLKRFVVAVKNYRAGEIAIDSVDNLLEYGEDIFIAIMASHLFDTMTPNEATVKNSEGSSDSRPLTTQPSSGTAQTAAPEASTLPEIVDEDHQQTQASAM